MDLSIPAQERSDALEILQDWKALVKRDRVKVFHTDSRGTKNTQSMYAPSHTSGASWQSASLEWPTVDLTVPTSTAVCCSFPHRHLLHLLCQTPKGAFSQHRYVPWLGGHDPALVRGDDQFLACETVLGYG